MFRFSAHRLSQTRRAESLRCHSAPFVPGLDAPGASVPPLRLRDLRRVCRACNQSRHPFLLQSLRLHSVTQAPFAGPVPTSEGRYHYTTIQLPVPEPETPSSLALTVIPSGSCRACRLACSLSERQKERCLRIALSDFLRVERKDVHTLQCLCIVEQHHTPEALARNIFTGNGKHGCASETQSVSIVFQFDILVIATNMPYATYVVKTCKHASALCQDFI